MTIGVVLGNSDVVAEDCREKVFGSNDFMGSGHYREMASTSTNMEIIKHSLGFVMCEASTKESVNSLLVYQ